MVKIIILKVELCWGAKNFSKFWNFPLNKKQSVDHRGGKNLDKAKYLKGGRERGQKVRCESSGLPCRVEMAREGVRIPELCFEKLKTPGFYVRGECGALRNSCIGQRPCTGCPEGWWSSFIQVELVAPVDHSLNATRRAQEDPQVWDKGVLSQLVDQGKPGHWDEEATEQGPCF